MRKQKLGALPVPARKTPLNEYKWTLEAEITEITKEKTLIINAYFKNNQEPNYRAFLIKDDYITQDLQCPVPTWRTGRFVHYVSHNWWERDNKGIYIEEKYKNIIEEFIEIKDDEVMNAISRFQDSITHAETLKKEKRITDPIDKKMEEIKELPKDFNKWLINDVFIKSRYIYYQYQSKVNLNGYCTHCGNDVVVYKPKHDTSGICPSCGSNIIYKSIGKSTHIENKRNVAVFQKTSDGFAIRFFQLNKKYGRNYQNPRMVIDEVCRDFYDKDLKVESYEYSMFKNKYMRWNKTEYRRGSNSVNVYPHNIKASIEGTKLQYSAVDVLASNKIDFKFSLDYFITKYKTGNIYLEHFIKVELFNLAKDVANSYNDEEINTKGKTLNTVLGIQNDDIKLLIKANVTLKGLKLFKMAREYGKRLTVEQLKEIIEKNYEVNRLEKIFKYVPVIKALRYLRELPKYISEKEIIYSDYLDSCIKLKQDMKNSFVLFPKDLRNAHDVNVELMNSIKNEKTYKEHNSKYSAIKKMRKELNNLYFYEDDKFLIRAPEDAAEIVKEGQALHHCVGGGGYSDRMAKKSIAILFLRDKENISASYYTIEVNRKTNEILQCHGYGNQDKDKARIEPFLKKFKRDKLNKILLDKEAV